MGRLSLVSSIFVALLLTAGTSFAQGVPDSTGDPDTENPLGTEPVDTEPVVAEPVVDEPPPPPPPTVAEADLDEGVPDATISDTGGSDGMRPDGWGFGIGLGYTFPADLDRINTTSFRFRFPSGFTIEPIVELSTDADTTEFMGADSDRSEFDFRAAAVGRIPILSNGRLDFIVLAGAGVTVDNDNEDGSDNDTSTVVLSGVWGLAIDYWISQHWAFSLNAFNPVFAIVLDNQEMGPGAELKTTNIELGAVFDPTIGAMIHLFF
jgi:hypothetical protein